MKRILLIEDDDAMREALVESLEDRYQVTPAASGAEALRAAEQHPFDLVITDIRMADMDGLETLAQLRFRFPDLQSIVITGYADEDAPLRALDLKASDYLYKPFQLAELNRAVERVLGRKQERGLLDSLVEGWRRWSGQQAEKEQQLLESQRDHAYRSLFLAMRSRALSLSNAYILWLVLEEMDQRIEDPRERTQLAQEFAAMERLIRAASRRRADHCQPQEFQRLYDRVVDGSLSNEQIMLGGLVRRMPPAVRERSPDLAGLYEAMWGGAG